MVTISEMVILKIRNRLKKAGFFSKAFQETQSRNTQF
jgi:hypothetical protein